MNMNTSEWIGCKNCDLKIISASNGIEQIHHAKHQAGIPAT